MKESKDEFSESLQKMADGLNGLFREMSRIVGEAVQPFMDALIPIGYQLKAQRFYGHFGIPDNWRIVSWTGEKLYHFYLFRKEIRKECDERNRSLLGDLN